MGLVGRRHAVRLVDDDEVPVNLPQPRQNVLPFGEVEGRDDALLLLPLVEPKLLADVRALHDLELGLEFLLQFALPLEGEVRGTDDQNPLGEAAQLQLPDQEPRHDGLARARVIGQQEPHTGELEQIVVDRLQLVGKRVHAGNGQSEVRIELVGDAERVGLDSETKQLPVAAVVERRVQDGELLDVRRVQRYSTEPFAVHAYQTGDPGSRTIGAHGFHPHRLAEERAGDNLSLADGVLFAHSDFPFEGCFRSASSSSFISISRRTRNGCGIRLPFSQWFTVL